MRAPNAGGEPLPSVFPELTTLGATARRGEVMMIVAQPSAGKSVIALWMAINWTTRHDLRGLIFSADATAKAVAQRAASMLLGRPVNVDDPVAQETIEGLKGIEWSFDSDITGESLELNVEAFVEKWGCEPDFVVIDNLTDVDTRDGDEFGVLRAMMRDLNYMARATGAATIVLHHVSESEKDDPCPPRRAIHGKVSVKPTVILATARADGDRKPIAVLKNRYGPEDRSGRSPVWIPFSETTFTFGGLS
jgi:KaiC/GvpD/RAD55 family RecA-like ATPase